MAKIVMSVPGIPHKCEIDTGAMDVRIKEAYLGIALVASNGNTLYVSMRDSGFETHYVLANGDDGGWVDFKAGIGVTPAHVGSTSGGVTTCSL